MKTIYCKENRIRELDKLFNLKDWIAKQIVRKMYWEILFKYFEVVDGTSKTIKKIANIV